MWSCEDYVIAHCKRIYGMQILYKNRKIYIKAVDDTYRLDLGLVDEEIYRFHSLTKPVVMTETCLPRALFRLAAHATYQKAETYPTQKDWEKFLNDAYKHEILMEESNG